MARAAASLTLTVETDAIANGLALLKAADQALAKRHGEVFRQLDRRIAAFLEAVGRGDGKGFVAVMYLSDGICIAGLDGDLVEILRDARRLELI